MAGVEPLCTCAEKGTGYIIGLGNAWLFRSFRRYEWGRGVCELSNKLLSWALWGDLSSAPEVQLDCLGNRFSVFVAWFIEGGFSPHG